MPRNNLGRLNPDGSVDLSFNPGAILNPSANDSVFSLALQADGRWLAAGFFAITNQTPRRNLLRFHPDGSLDASFPVVTNTNVRRVRMQPDGRILVGGSFNSFTGQVRTNLARLNPDGSLDAAFTPVARGGLGTGVSDLALQGDGKIVVAGGFDSLAGAARNNCGRLHPDGSLDRTLVDLSSLGTISRRMESVALQPDGQVLVGGAFTQLSGLVRTNFGRIKPDGSVDPSFNLGIRVACTDCYNSVRATAVQPDGKILIAGDITRVSGQVSRGIARVNRDGTSDSQFSTTLAGAFLAICVQEDGRILVGGSYIRRDAFNFDHLRRVSTNGVIEPDFNPQFNPLGGGARVMSLAVQPDGKILVGGIFDHVDGGGGSLLRRALCRLLPNGTLDATFDPSPNAEVTALALQPDGKILLSGLFTNLAGHSCNGMGRLHPDGSFDETFVTAVNGQVLSFALQTDGDILLGGFFTSVSGLPRQGLARLLPNGAVDQGFTNTADNGVYGVMVQSDGKAVVVGGFSRLDGLVRTNLARLSASGGCQSQLSLKETGTGLRWVRSGPSPEVSGVTFELATNGAGFFPLGRGTRVAGEWQLDGVNLPEGQGFIIRAHGRTTGGYLNSSSGLIESVAQFWRLPPPFLNNVQVLGDGQFQFSFTNTNATAFSVLASTNAAAPLAQWESLGAPVSVGGGTYQFTDPGTTNHTRRFYQLRSP